MQNVQLRANFAMYRQLLSASYASFLNIQSYAGNRMLFFGLIRLLTYVHLTGSAHTVPRREHSHYVLIK